VVQIIFLLFIFFFFQAEDGIRDRNVTGVQTCALRSRTCGIAGSTSSPRSCCSPRCCWLSSSRSEGFFASCPRGLESLLKEELEEIGRASCRERVEGGVGAVS